MIDWSEYKAVTDKYLYLVYPLQVKSSVFLIAQNQQNK